MVHEDDNFLIIGDICGLLFVIIGIAMGVSPWFTYLLLSGKCAEIYMRYRRYDSSLLDIKVSKILPL
jgi:hypothetical protein